MTSETENPTRQRMLLYRAFLWEGVRGRETPLVRDQQVSFQAQNWLHKKRMLQCLKTSDSNPQRITQPPGNKNHKNYINCTSQPNITVHPNKREKFEKQTIRTPPYTLHIWTSPFPNNRIVVGSINHKQYARPWSPVHNLPPWSVDLKWRRCLRVHS